MPVYFFQTSKQISHDLPRLRLAYCAKRSWNGWGCSGSHWTKHGTQPQERGCGRNTSVVGQTSRHSPLQPDCLLYGSGTRDSFNFKHTNRREIIVRGQSYFSRLPKYWPPIPLSARRVRNKGGGYTLAGRRGGWGVNILEDERNRIALLQWSLFDTNQCMWLCSNYILCLCSLRRSNKCQVLWKCANNNFKKLSPWSTPPLQTQELKVNTNWGQILSLPDLGTKSTLAWG